MISTRNLGALSGIDDLRRLCQSLAMLDAIHEPEWQYRYYSFNSRWNPDEMMASMRNGSGDEYFILFTADGAAIKGFAHESPMARFTATDGKVWPGVLDQVPAEFAGFLAEPAFSMEWTTFCIWRRHTDPAWQIGDIDFPAGEDPDGSAGLLAILDGDLRTYQQWSEDYHERDVPLDLIEQLYRHRPLTADLVAGLNPEVALDHLAEDIAEIGYPVAPGGGR